MKKLQFLNTSSKKILAINGSHRNGNTQFLLSKMISIFNENLPSTQGVLINLREHKINYATQLDYGCPKKNMPIEDDDMPEIFSLMQSADVLIFGTPIYFYSVSGRMKTLIDRCNKYYWENKIQGKNVLTIMVGGSTEPTETINSLDKFYEFLKLKNMGYEFFKAESPNDLQNNPQAIRKIQMRTRQIIEM